jgi:hypothetical protein
MAAANPSNQQKLYGAYGLFWFSFLFFIIAMGAPNWSSYSATQAFPGGSITISSYSGLWRGCATVGGNSQCKDVSCTSTAGDKGACSKLDATRAFTIFAFFGMFACAVVLTLYIFLEKLATKGMNVPASVTTHTSNKKVVLVVLMVTNFLIMLAWAIFASIDMGPASYDFCFVFMILVWLFMFGIMALIWFTEVEGRSGGANAQAKPATTTTTAPKA